jgi:hypothetical protein
MIYPSIEHVNITLNAYKFNEYQKNNKKMLRLKIIAKQRKQITCSDFLIGNADEIIQFLFSAAVIDL